MSIALTPGRALASGPVSASRPRTELLGVELPGGKLLGGKLLGRLLVGLGTVLVPWLGTLAVAGQWNWVGLDALEAAGLITTGLLLRRADPRRCLTAAATAVLLLADAWFDVTTAAPGAELGTALAMAVLLELPLACLCARLALRSLPGR